MCRFNLKLQFDADSEALSYKQTIYKGSQDLDAHPCRLNCLQASGIIIFLFLLTYYMSI